MNFRPNFIKDERPFIPGNTEIETVFPCADGRGRLFALATRVGREHNVENRLYPILSPDQDTPYEEIATRLGKDPTVRQVSIVRACLGASHADADAASRMPTYHGASLNERVAAFALADDDIEPRLTDDGPAIDPIAGRVVDLAESTLVLPPAEGQYLPLVVDGLMQILRGGDIIHIDHSVVKLFKTEYNTG